ncbi:MAG TPA: helix-turn-helix transcriptional regulator [Candidatus Methylomirabilis sp.]|nr:helix-turn-helix transcriptional regulator [Candidatus Methylomirabilis sp.]
MSDKSVPFIVRRARLLLGMTVAEFAGLHGVDEATVTQWERGLAHPSAQIWARIRSVTLSASSVLEEELVRASPLYKFIADMEDLTSPIAVSKGIIESIEAVGASKEENFPLDFAQLDRQSPHYEITGTRALEIIQADPGWRSDDIVYAEAHCLALPLGIWVEAMVAPLPDRLAALIEFASSKRGAEGGFWVRLVRLEEMSALWP